MAESPGCCSIWAHCLHCLYSCHWRKCPKERMQASKCDCIWFGLLFLTFLLSLSWLYIGLILLNDLHNFNERCAKERERTGKDFHPSPHFLLLAFLSLTPYVTHPLFTSPGLETAVLLTRINNFMTE
ncbi:Glycerophosphodiester phosphodiesterase domain-containing protein 2 [Heterocephalus glaber]|uniref:Glycerophosphodiester phosphodiesterase domain-containing protein 2 n=1 Tax=Heterocephalus glaber TaxID=10181 RepID=G5B6C5_HETGA|nr:Glycerophosphodiester phosphodiesterase domain-containing protein 2 [Heterocephalus glaber]